MNTHWYAKHAEGEYKCCGKSFRGYTAYTQHWAAVHGFQCYSCARSFMSAQERDEHHLGCFVPVHRPAVPYLILTLESERKGLVAASLTALQQISRKRFGPDPVRWTAWWELQPDATAE